MKDASAKSLRDRQRDATAELIVRAVGQCLTDVELSDLTFAQVAVAAGVGERTVYRHFPNKDALLDAWWADHKSKLNQDRFPSTADELADFPLKAFPVFDQEAEIMRGAVLSPQGRAMTLARNDERKAAILSAVRARVGGQSADDELALAAVIQLLQSATAWLTMRDYWDFDGSRAGEAASRAIKALFASAQNKTF